MEYVGEIPVTKESLQEAVDTIVANKEAIAELEAELAYLRWFHSNADFGPAHTDVVMAMQATYPDVVPENWLYE